MQERFGGEGVGTRYTQGSGRSSEKGRLLLQGTWEEQVWGASRLELIKEDTGQNVSVVSDATQYRGSAEL